MPISHARIAACVYRCCSYQKRLYICLPSVELSVLRILIISLILNARTAITKYHRLGVFNNRNYFLSSEGCKSRVKVSVSVGSSETSLVRLSVATFYLGPHMFFPWLVTSLS